MKSKCTWILFALGFFFGLAVAASADHDRDRGSVRHQSEHRSSREHRDNFSGRSRFWDYQERVDRAARHERHEEWEHRHGGFFHHILRTPILVVPVGFPTFDEHPEGSVWWYNNHQFRRHHKCVQWYCPDCSEWEQPGNTHFQRYFH